MHKHFIKFHQLVLFFRHSSRLFTSTTESKLDCWVPFLCKILFMRTLDVLCVIFKELISATYMFPERRSSVVIISHLGRFRFYRGCKNYYYSTFNSICLYANIKFEQKSRNANFFWTLLRWELLSLSLPSSFGRCFENNRHLHQHSVFCFQKCQRIKPRINVEHWNVIGCVNRKKGILFCCCNYYCYCGCYTQSHGNSMRVPLGWQPIAFYFDRTWY